jgi:hypothetical protein
MLVEIRTPYEVNEYRERPWTRGHRHADNFTKMRHARIIRDVAFVSDEIAPTAYRIKRSGDQPLEVRWFRGALVSLLGAGFLPSDFSDGDMPLMVTERARHASSNSWNAPLESEADVSVGGQDRLDAITDAEVWAAAMLIGPDLGRRGFVDPLRPFRTFVPVGDEMIVVVPPGHLLDGFAGISGLWRIGKERPKKIPMLLTFSVFEDRLSDPLFLALLREDRLFRIDEHADAKLRARDFGSRLTDRCSEFEILDASLLCLEPSTMALRLTAREAIEASAGLDNDDLTVAKSILRRVVDDPQANAATFCAPVRSFLAAFHATSRLLVASKEADLAQALDFLERAYARAQHRMAEGRIPDADSRDLAPQDDLALSRLGAGP